MTNHKTPDYVYQADRDFITIKAVNPEIIDTLIKIGFIKNNELYSIKTKDISDKSAIVEKIRDIGLLFSDGKEWCPAEVFEYLREEKLISGKYSKISFTGNENFIIHKDI